VSHSVDAAAQVHSLKVTLRDVRPAVWRRLEVPSTITLGELHEVLQDAFGWADDHLHDFRVRGARYTPLGPELSSSSWFGEPARDEDVAPLVRVAPRAGDVVDYTYDFGDDWRHRIQVEHVGPAAPEVCYPVCTAGSGSVPEEDTGRSRSCRFDDHARQELNRLLLQHGAVPGRELPADEDGIDPVFAGLFPDLYEEESECPCGCGDRSGVSAGERLPVLHAAADAELAALAAQSPLVRRAVALATWVGSGRSLTPSRVLRPADAVTAVNDLGLAKPLLSPSADGGQAAGNGAVPSVGSVRSAKDLPQLHPLWQGCLAAGLVDVRGGKAYAGHGLAVWQGLATPLARVESWAALLAGYLRARDDDARADRGFFLVPKGQVLQASIPLLYSAGDGPFPTSAMAVTLADLDGLDGVMGFPALLMMPLIVSELAAVFEDWLVAGVVSLVPDGEGEVAQALSELRDGMQAQFSALTSELHGCVEEAEVRAGLTAAADALVGSPVVEVTPLGAYGLARLLVAHGWEVPQVGDCANVPPGELLDRLSAYRSQDVLTEASGWLDARGDSWADALREVIHTAAVKGSDGPPRRAVLPGVLAAAGPRVIPVLDAVRNDPWVSAVVALTRCILGLGPELTQAQRLWIMVDGLSLLTDDPDGFAEAVEDAELGELLAEPDAVAAAVRLDHPSAAEVLRAAALHLEDPALSRALRRALAGGSGNPALRPAGSRAGRRRRGRR
jgi:hypothetical protein